MKNFIVFFLIIMVISFVTPNLFIHDVLAIDDLSVISNEKLGFLSGLKEKFFKDEKSGEEKEFAVISEESEFGIKNNTIKLLLTEQNEVIELNFDEYIKGVLVGEMPVSFEIEALKAQALVARTYTLYKLKNSESSHENADICDNVNCCQCYKTKEYAFASWEDSGESDKWLKIEEAVESTKNQVITYNGEIIAAFFHANSGGKTEDVKYIWGEEEIPYLKSVAGFEIDLEEDNETLSSGEFEKIINEKDFAYAYKSGDIKILDYTTSGRVNSIQVGSNTIKATEFRNLFGLKSTNIEIKATDEEIKIKTKGYGHGVGMSQVGANQMALEGEKYDEIVKHYYSGVEIQMLDNY